MKAGTENLIKFKQLMRDLGLPLYACKGLLVALWQFTANNAPRGDIGRFCNRDIAAAIDWPEDQADAMIAALIRRRWLDPCLMHRLVVHDWHDHVEKWVRQRAKRAAALAGSDEVFVSVHPWGDQYGPRPEVAGPIELKPNDMTSQHVQGSPSSGTRGPGLMQPGHARAGFDASAVLPNPNPNPNPVYISGPSLEGGGGAGGTMAPDSSPPSSSSKPESRVQLDLYGDGPDHQGEGPHRAPSARVDHRPPSADHHEPPAMRFCDVGGWYAPPATADHHHGAPGPRPGNAGAGQTSPATADHDHGARAAGPDGRPAEPDERPRQAAQIVELATGSAEDFAAAVEQAVAEALEPGTLRRMQRVWPLLNIAQEVRQIGEWMLANPTQVDRPRRAIQGALAAKHDKLRAEQQQALRRRDAVKGRAPAGPVREGQPAPKAAAAPARRLPTPSEQDRRRAAAGAWPAMLEQLRVDVDAESLATWLEPLGCVGFGPTGVWLEAETEFIAGWVARNYAEQIGFAARAVLELDHLEAPPQVFVQARAEGLDHGGNHAAEC